MSDFEWDTAKDKANRAKHGIAFALAQRAFLDPMRVIAEDIGDSRGEPRYFCFGRVDGAVMTVRFTWRNAKIRIFGAGYWRKGRTIYEKANREKGAGQIQQRRDRSGPDCSGFPAVAGPTGAA